MIQHRALVDRALVGDFATIDRQRRIDKDRARIRVEDPVVSPESENRRETRRGSRDRPRRREVIEGKRRIDQTAAVEIENDKRRHFVALMRRSQPSRTSGAQAATNTRGAADADPGGASQLEVLGNAAIEIERR